MNSSIRKKKKKRKSRFYNIWGIVQKIFSDLSVLFLAFISHPYLISSSALVQLQGLPLLVINFDNARTQVLVDFGFCWLIWLLVVFAFQNVSYIFECVWSAVTPGSGGKGSISFTWPNTRHAMAKTSTKWDISVFLILEGTAWQEIFFSEKFHHKRQSGSLSGIYLRQTPVITLLLFGRLVVSLLLFVCLHIHGYFWSHTCDLWKKKLVRNLISVVALLLIVNVHVHEYVWSRTCGLRGKN